MATAAVSMWTNRARSLPKRRARAGGAPHELRFRTGVGGAPARRRVDAESALSRWCGEHGIALVILRAPGIYAADRLPVAHLTRGVPVLAAEDDVYTNHIHADDLAGMLTAGLALGEGAYNASDDSEMKMGDYFDLVADRLGLPRPPRVRRAEAAGRISPVLLSYVSESRRLVNRRVKAELGIRRRHPTV